MLFPEAGYLRIEQAFARDDAAIMCDLLWQTFEREFGIRRTDPSTWSKPFRKRPLDAVVSQPVFRAVFDDRFAAAINGLLGADALWEWPTEGGDLLITFPNATAWELPSEGWHRDWYVKPASKPRGMKAFAYFNDVVAGGGGTLVVQGSHLLARGSDENEPVGTEGSKRERIFDDYPWLNELCTPGNVKKRYQRFVLDGAEIDGVRLKVVELTGAAGDVVIIHPWLIHAIAPNAGTSPRFMRAPVITFER